jgi:MoaA/NifB/PqqE/SkfB family radical SAM enzyme
MITPATHRGICNRCRREYALREDGLVRAHDRINNASGVKEECPGTYTKPRANTVSRVKRPRGLARAAA